MSIQKKTKRRKDLKQGIYWKTFVTEDLNNQNFKKTVLLFDILSFLLQNFSPINLERKLDSEKEWEMVTFLWDEFVTHDFVRYMYKIENYIDISKPNLTYQKANNIAKKFTSEPPNRINLLIYKIEEKFKLIHYIYSSLFSKIYNRTSQFGIQNKNTFIFIFKLGKTENKMVW